MNVEEAYKYWSEQYDTNINKTRDLEAIAMREIVSTIKFENCLEIGCGTGKNTEWLLEKGNKVKAIDLSNEMLAKAKTKIQSKRVEFIQADILKEWIFANAEKYDLVTFSLVLEHIENLNNIFQKLRNVVQNKGYIYIGELHPFKQYNGSKARFETEEGVKIVPCFNHHISDFTDSAKENGFEIIEVKEYFDNNDRTTLPRILTLLFQKKEVNKN